MMINHIKAGIDNTQQIIKCRLCGNKDQTINHIVDKGNKLVQKEHKTRCNWVGKMLLLELCKKLKFDHTIKWYIHKPESVQENNTQKILLDFEIPTNHLIPSRRLDLKIILKKALLGSTRVLRRVLKTWRDLLSLGLQWKTINYYWCEKLARTTIII